MFDSLCALKPRSNQLRRNGLISIELDDENAFEVDE